MKSIKDFIIDVIRQAGDEVLKFYGKTSVINNKDNKVAIVTEADLASENIIVNAIKQTFTTHGIQAEESGNYNQNSEYIWYIDPIDGTKNFLSRVPLYGINIALAYKGKVILSAINLPSFGEIAVAEEGKGAYLITKEGESKLICSQKEDWQGICGLGAPRQSTKHLKFYNSLEEISNSSSLLYGIGSPALCAVWVADGRRDFYISTGVNGWDFAAPYLIAKESGCLISDLDRKEWHIGSRGILMSNSFFHEKLLEFAINSYPKDN